MAGACAWLKRSRIVRRVGVSIDLTVHASGWFDL
jgi:hypothetical protein